LEFAREGNIDAFMFDDKQAAKNLALGFEDQTNYIAYLWHLKAHYHHDRDEGSEFVEFLFPELNGDLPQIKRVKIWLKKPATG
jgi:hypothetical protein